MIKDSRAEKKLAPKKSKSKTVWKSVHLIAKSLKAGEKDISENNNDLFKHIADARKAQEQITVDSEVTGSKNKKVIENGKKLGHAIARLRIDFSKEAARNKKGGELTEKEKAEFEKIKGKQKELLAKLTKLEK